MLLIPDTLQLATIPLILFLLSKAVLAVVVTQTPLIALISHTGGSGSVGVGGVTGISFSLHEERKINSKKNEAYS